MYLLSVMPISSSAHTDVLDYFSKDDVRPGMVVKISVRKKIINGLVLSSTAAANAKHAIKNSNFTLKKIIDVVGPSPIGVTFLESIQKLSRYLVAAPGVVIANSVPQWLFSALLQPNKKIKRTNTNAAVSVLQDSIVSRVDYYQSLVRDGKQVLIICPTEDQQKKIISLIGTSVSVIGIPQKPPAKKITTIVSSLHNTQAGIVVASPMGIGLVTVINPDVVVIENESDNRYIRQKTPHLDMRIIIEQIAKDTATDCIIADTLVRSYTHARISQKEIVVHKELIWPDVSNVSVVSYVKNNDAVNEKRNPLFSNELITLVEKQQAHEKILVYVPRKGLAPMVVCQDCGTAVVCSECGVLRKLTEQKTSDGRIQRMYTCMHKQHTVPAYDTCSNCGGHRLQGLGVSTLSVRDELQKLFAHKSIFVLDQDSADSPKKQQHIIDTFFATENAILVATSSVFSFLDSRITTVVIPSLDMLLSHPSPEAQESIVHTVIQCSALTSAKVIVQTRLPEHPLINAIINNTISDWCAAEQNYRLQFQFSPFSIWISIHARISLSHVETFKKIVGTIPVRPHSIGISKTAIKNQLHAVATFKIPVLQWNMENQDAILRRLFSQMPFGYHIELATRTI